MLASRYAFGRRTIRMPEPRQKRRVRSRRGAIQPRRPASTNRAGSRVTAARNTTATEMPSTGPAFRRIPNWVKIIPRNVTATVAADAAITLPIEVSARATAASESRPSRR